MVWRGCRRGTATREAFRVREKRGAEDCAATVDRLRREAVVHVVRRAETERAVAVLAVVPVEEGAAVVTRVLDVREAVGEAGAILERLEVRLRERVIVRDVWSRVGLGDAEV